MLLYLSFSFDRQTLGGGFKRQLGGAEVCTLDFGRRFNPGKVGKFLLGEKFKRSLICKWLVPYHELVVRQKNSNRMLDAT